MRRFHGMFVIIALLAAPIALLARGFACDMSECDCKMTCAMQVSHSRPMCGMATHAPMCATHQGHHPLDYGFIAPFAPAVPLPQAALVAPVVSREFVSQLAQFSVDGISSAPFEPPRS
jgi:hypothetical protein